MKLLTIFNDSPINYKNVVKSNPDINVFVTISKQLSQHQFYNIDYALELFLPFIKLGHNSPLFIYVRENTFRNRTHTYQIVYTIFVYLTSSHFSEFEYSLLQMFSPSTYYNDNKFKIICKPRNYKDTTVIFDEYYKGRYHVMHDDKILGFHKAIPNPNYIAPKNCSNCLYHVNSMFLSCTVRPGNNQLCNDYVKRELQ